MVAPGKWVFHSLDKDYYLIVIQLPKEDTDWLNSL